MDDMPQKAVAFAVPSLTHSVGIEFMRSMLQTDWLLHTHGWRRVYLDNCGCQFVANARSELVYDYMTHHPDVEDFFFLDDDLGWDPQAVLRALESDKDIYVGVYPKRQDDPDWPVMLMGHEGKLVRDGKLVRALRAPTGFMRIKRQVFEKLMPLHRTFKWMNSKGEVKEVPALFSAGLMDDGWFWTEDYIFCQNAAAVGFEIWVDPDIQFSHRGPKAWQGNFKSALPTFVKRAREAEKQRAEMEAARVIAEASPAHEQTKSDAA